jgi:hypothetical protein
VKHIENKVLEKEKNRSGVRIGKMPQGLKDLKIKLDPKFNQSSHKAMRPKILNKSYQNA